MKVYYLLILFLLTGRIVSAQCIAEDGSTTNPACNGIISTNPANPVNVERPDLKNYFNWMNNPLYCYHPSSGYTWHDGTNWQLPNPFHDFNNDYLRHISFYNFNLEGTPLNVNLLDFHPKDGWELLHRHMGLMPNEQDRVTDPAVNRNGPYFILYNKYTGTIRVVASFELGNNQDAMVTTLKFETGSGLNYSSLLNSYGGVSQPLDQVTKVTEVSMPSDYTVNKYPFTVDFKASYDPCICNYNSKIKFEFSTLNEANILLEGRLIGTSVPLTGSGESPLLNRRDFLSSVYKNGFTVNGGMLTYNNIDKLVDLYKTPTQSTFNAIALNALKAVLTGGAAQLDKVFNSLAGKFLTDRFAPIVIRGDTLIDGYKPSFGFLGAATKSLSASLFSEPKIPNISFIEAEMVMSGTYKDNTNVRPGNILLHNPGSKGSNNVNVNWTNYPAYNESLGLFALMETPKYAKYFNEYFVDEYPCYDSYIDYQVQLKDGFKYTFNPLANVNVAKTKIYGALVFEGAGGSMLSNVNMISNNLYVSNFYPIETLKRLGVEHVSGICSSVSGHAQRVARLQALKISLRLQIFYEFNPDQNGTIRRHWEVLTYPLNYADNVYAPSPYSTTIYSRNYTTSTQTKALDNIIINGTVSTNSGVTAEFVAGEYVVVRPTSVLKPGVLLKAIPVNQVYNDQQIPPVNNTYIKSFCSSTGLYRSNRITLPSGREVTAEESLEETPSESTDFDIFPNPSSGMPVLVQLKNTEHCPPRNLYVRDLFGKLVDVISIADASLNDNMSLTLPAAAGPGVYIVTLETTCGNISKKLIIH